MELATIELSAPVGFSDWLATGQTLARDKREIDWRIGDWLTDGRARFPEQIELALGELLDDPNQIRRIEKTCKTFPPHMRDSKLSFDHHAHVADLPVQQALPLLHTAKTERMNARQFRNHVVDYKVDAGIVLIDDSDYDDKVALAIVRLWNRASVDAREGIAEQIASADLGPINPNIAVLN